ncbi:MAG: DEAD/DEAH box helicase, partial [Pseudomonadota bacterium]
MTDQAMVPSREHAAAAPVASNDDQFTPTHADAGPAFTDLHLAASVLQALSESRYVTPTPIQAQAIPPVLDGRDLFGIAQTGTGKTAAFALPILTRLVKDRRRVARKGCSALVLAPTRELATQIAESFRTYGRFSGITVTTVFGGVGAGPQIKALARGVDVVVATPGRLQDLMRSGHCTLAHTDILVLDEADQMLDLGFLAPIRAIAAQTSPDRQSLFFSATLPTEIEKLAREMLRDPASVRVTPVSSTAERVDQQIMLLDRSRKPSMLCEILARSEVERTLVFARTKRGADRVAKSLEQHGIEARAIHGNKSQGQRQEALKAFRAGRVGVLVATDIAARGIDIPAVSHVINYELPETPEAYVHRIGRTARAGRAGAAISLCEPAERKLLRAIERVTKQTIASERITSPAPAFEDLAVAPPIVAPAPAPQPERGSGRPKRGGPERRRHRGAGGTGRSDRAPAERRADRAAPDRSASDTSAPEKRTADKPVRAQGRGPEPGGTRQEPQGKPRRQRRPTEGAPDGHGARDRDANAQG